jgi:hypothetical protein
VSLVVVAGIGDGYRGFGPLAFRAEAKEFEGVIENLELMGLGS